ncbi:DUF881 domain-containing protein [Cellulomonas alba]|uniref:DUF881 domain-containing protein n=1 Tax=Cellulomonas alba TaxID=3053467 RepID=A0ABT7SGA0_9CELL|nr:DUF881 domain-containing protein [Cellulomonas alba]MDM7855064.1 DUF881 domain-containing protein [Cellulomonas alba]
MNEHPHRARRLVARGTLTVALVLALSGALFAANAKFAHAQGGGRDPEDLAGLTKVETDRVTRLSKQVDGLSQQVAQLTDRENVANGDLIGSPGAGYVVEGGAVPVTGPGVTVRLDDAPQDAPLRDDVSPDVLVVHQQDIQGVMNALWAGGAEAMALEDQRVISTSAFRCVGNVLRLEGRLYSPPYEVRAIGDPTRLRAALDASPAVQAYLRDADEVGLGWSVTNASSPLELPAYSGATDLTAATVPPGTPVLPGLDAAGAEAKLAPASGSPSASPTPTSSDALPTRGTHR